MSRARDIRNQILGLPVAKRRWPPVHYREVAKHVVGRQLRHYEHVHHIDGNSSNDDPYNLLVVNNRDHARIHAGLAPRDFHWIGELQLSDCDRLDNELDAKIRRQIARETESPKPVRIPRATLTRSDMRIMKLV